MTEPNANDTTTQPPPQEDDMSLITVEKACEILQFTERYVRKLIKLGKLPVVTINLGGERDPVRLRKRDVLALIRPRVHPSPPPRPVV